MKLDLDDMELLEQLRKKLEMVEAFWWFAENSTEGFCCANTKGAKLKFEAQDADDVFDLISVLHKRKEDNGRGD